MIMKKSLISYSVFLFILLGALTAFGPLVTDMYLPALPGMANYFSTTASMVQLGLTTSMIGLAVGQLIFGPLSDKFGRRPLLLASMLVFIVSTLLCIYSPNIETFIALRLLQGIAGAGGIVISRSVATDMFSGKELAKSMAIIGAINGVAPVAAPVLGGFFTDIIGWRGIFWILLGIGILLLMAVVRFRESLKPEYRKQEGLKQMFLGFPAMLHNRRYVYFVLQYGFSSGVLFANIASSPFIMQQHYGFSPMMFSIVFGVNSLAIGIAAASSVKFHNTESGTFIGSLGMLMFSALLLFALWLECSFWVYELLLLAVIFMLGLTFTSSTTLAMDSGRENSGTASALFGAVGFAFGGIVSPLVGIGNILTTTGIVFVVCSLFAVFFAVKAVRTSVGMRASLRPLKHLTKHK